MDGVNEDKPDTEMPPEPFTVMHVGRVAVIENIRGYRAAGGTWAEVIAAQASIFVATFLVNGGTDG